jgi:hypothetical protein
VAQGFTGPFGVAADAVYAADHYRVLRQNGETYELLIFTRGIAAHAGLLHDTVASSPTDSPSWCSSLPTGREQLALFTHRLLGCRARSPAWLCPVLPGVDGALLTLDTLYSHRELS